MSEITIPVGRDLRAEMRAAADAFRMERELQGTLFVRLLSSPGAGKTSLLQATAVRLRKDYNLAVLVGDIETDRDAQRLAPLAPTVQITTGGCCHLELPMVQHAFAQLLCPAGAKPFDLLFIEDVGNLVCPASYDLGEHLRVILLSTPEGDDKPGKYPKAFRTSQALVITKTDLLPFVPFNVEAAIADARRIQPLLQTLCVSAQSGEGIVPWCELLVARRRHLLASEESGRIEMNESS